MINHNTVLSTLIHKRESAINSEGQLKHDILEYIKTNKNHLSFESIFEGITGIGLCPQLLYHDDGHYAVTDDVYVGNGTMYTGKAVWKETIREALYYYLETK